jgi:hypothetical protein
MTILPSAPSEARLALAGYGLLLLLGLGTGQLFAQGAPPAAQAQATSPPGSFATRVLEIERGLVESEPGLKRLPPARRKTLIEFVIGNVLFVAAHELGHGVLAEFKVPNPGREEDAADNFAILTALRMGSDFSHGVLVEATKGWYLTDLRDRATGRQPSYYGAHGMNLQRAYQIVCMMVGSDPEKFRELTVIARMPEHRQQSCKLDFDVTAWSWETLLMPRLRSPDQPKQEIALNYGDAKGKLAVYAKAFRDMRFLETLVEAIGDRYAWPQPFSMEMVECGHVGASWRFRRFRICYEMAQHFAETYRDYGDKLKTLQPQAKKSRKG